MPNTESGRPVRLGAQIARGGEGAIYEVAGAHNIAAKIYLTPPGPERARKLRVMAALPAERRPRPAAWPSDVLLEGGRVVGFLMPRVHGRREIQELLPPAVRRRNFPDADYKFLAVAAANLARAVGAVQQAGAVVGDVNERVAMVGGDATVVLIDCDSMQIEDGGTLLSCDVGVPYYQPPENQGRPLAGLRRLRNHDSFGLGVLVFQLLFFGRHPFSGTPVAGETPDPLAAIRGHQFAWSADAARRGLVAPPSTLPLGAVGPRLAQLFERAFGPDGPRLGRPTATAWANSLDDFAASLARCGANRLHWSLEADCPLCRLEAGLGTPLFLAPLVPAALPGPRRVAEQLRRALAAVPDPQVPASRPTPSDWAALVQASPPPIGARPPSALARAAAALLGVGAAVSWNKERRRRAEILARARAAFDAKLRTWDFAAAMQAAREGRRELGLLIDRLDSLGIALDERVNALRTSGREQQLRAYLEGFGLRGTPIEGIGDGRLRTLESAGIWTAAEVTRAALLRAPGIGPVFTERLMAWRARCEQGFRFDARQPTDPRALAQVAADIAAKVASGEAAVRSGIAELATRASAVGAAAASLHAALDGLARAVAQAEADLHAMR